MSGQRMQWARLLDQTRFNSSGEQLGAARSPVTVFQEDATRILYSSPFRRLQGKTQVHPFPVYDYLRTRLTHSIEVASVGRVIATGIAEKMARHSTDIPNSRDIGDIVYAACLAHDLGNPPFGHIGEHAIQTWFHAHTSPRVMELLKSEYKNDFTCFDGNAQGFRTLTRLASWRHEGGMQLSGAVLGAFSKYPHSSKYATEKKKFGFMMQDQDAAKKIYDALGLHDMQEGKYCRHPLAYLVEAADDICYLTTDIEDAHRMDLIPFEGVELLLRQIARSGNHAPRYESIPKSNKQDRIAYLRAGAVSALIDEVISVFLDREDIVMRGELCGSTLLGISKQKENVAEIVEICRRKIYISTPKLQIEAAGYNVIMGLMNLYGGMMLQLLDKTGIVNDLDKRNLGLYNLLPSEFQLRLIGQNTYEYMLVLVDYVAGMTDRYALDLFQKLTGSSTTLGRMT